MLARARQGVRPAPRPTHIRSHPSPSRQIKSFQILSREPRSVILHQHESCDFSKSRITYVAGVATDDGDHGKQDNGLDGTGGIKIGGSSLAPELQRRLTAYR
jgi:hypothetical protein